MKKLIFGCILMLCGTIGLCGCFITSAILVEEGIIVREKDYWQQDNSFLLIHWDLGIFLCILLFVAIIICGAVIAIREIINNK